MEQAWNRAQPRLLSIRDALHPKSLLRSRIIRVGQLDSELLDQELVQILKEPLNQAFALVNYSFRSRFEPELTLLIRLTLYKLSVWNIGASYGAKLQGLRYVTPPSHGRVLSPSGIPRRTLLIHGALTILLPYLHTRLRTHALSHAWPDAPSSDRRRQAWGVLTSLESSYALLGLCSFVAFLRDGRYRTIVDRMLKLSLVPSSHLLKRDVSYEFMNRQMVWHAFTEFLLFLLPLISGRSIRRHLMRLVSALNLTSFSRLLPWTTQSVIAGPSQKGLERNGKYWAFPKDQCAICAENESFNMNPRESVHQFPASFDPGHLDSRGETSASSSHESIVGFDTHIPAYPIQTPYRASCGCVYCYHCLAERIMRAAEEEEVWECIRCGKVIRSGDRLVVGNGEDTASDIELSDIDTADLSESTTSHSE